MVEAAVGAGVMLVEEGVVSSVSSLEGAVPDLSVERDRFFSSASLISSSVVLGALSVLKPDGIVPWAIDGFRPRNRRSKEQNINTEIRDSDRLTRRMNSIIFQPRKY
jgi:hypothetical protein